MSKETGRYSKSDSEKIKNTRSRSNEIYEHSGGFLPPELTDKSIKKYSSRREITTYIFFAVLIVLVVALVIAALGFVFRLRQVEIVKSDDFPLEYSDDYITESAGLTGYKNLLFIDCDDISSDVRKNISSIGVGYVKKTYPSKIKIAVYVEKPSYYTMLGDAYYALDKDFTVISKTNDIDSLELDRATFLCSKKISRCVMGERIEFSDIDMPEVLYELDRLLDKYKIKSMCTDIELDSKFDISFLYQDRLRVKLGDLYDLDIKLQFFEGICEKLEDTDSAVIDISDRSLREAIVTRYN